MRIIPKITLTLNEVAAALGYPQIYPPSAYIKAVSTDTRMLEGGDIFIPIRGERFDGEDFTEVAIKKGAYLVSKKNADATFKTEDTESALLKIAALHKSKLTKLKATVAITGSTGKTTTKNILTALLSKSYVVHSTHENYNNTVGVVHTLLNADKDTEILIAELGMNHPGEIERLSDAVSPDVSIITNIGSAHIGNLGSRQSIAKAKLEILHGMKNKHLIAPYEEELLSPFATYKFSLENEMADCYIKEKSRDSQKSVVDIFTKNKALRDAVINLAGRQVLYAVAACVGVIEFINADLELLTNANDRLGESCIRGKFLSLAGRKIYDDTYSSSPEAVAMVLDNLSRTEDGRKSCVLGDMLELGEKTEELHEKIGELAVQYGFKSIFAFGEYAEYIKCGAMKAGMSESSVFINKDLSSPEITARQILTNTEKDELILFKASHKVMANRIYDFLK